MESLTTANAFSNTYRAWQLRFLPSTCVFAFLLMAAAVSFVLDPRTLANSCLKNSWTIHTVTAESRQKGIAKGYGSSGIGRQFDADARA